MLSFNYISNFVRDARYFTDKDSDIELSEGMKSFYRDAEPIALSEVMSDLDGTNLEKQFSPSVRYLSAKRFELRLLREQVFALIRAYLPNYSMPFSTRLAIDTVTDVCQRSQCVPIIAFIPAIKKWHPNSNSPLHAQLLSDYSASKGLQFFDATQPLSALGERAYAIQGGHLSPEGYKLFADELARRLERH